MTLSGTDATEQSFDERKQISETARCNIHSEVKLILSAGFGARAVIYFAFARLTFLPIADAKGIRPTVVWITLSFLTACAGALWHHRTARPKILQARKREAELIYEQQRR